jgi:hypothetical protein
MVVAPELPGLRTRVGACTCSVVARKLLCWLDLDLGGSPRVVAAKFGLVWVDVASVGLDRRGVSALR